MPTSETLVAKNLDSGTVVARRVTVAKRRLERAVGLLTRDRLDAGDGLLIVPCRGVHTWFMRFTIDIIVLNAVGRVVDAVAGLRPWRVRLPRQGSFSVLELPEGTLLASHTEIGHRILLEKSGIPRI
jgi:uncharacterized membrane protein (UPF0127 family)